MSSLPSWRVARARSTLIWEMFSIRVARSLPLVDSVVLTFRVFLMAKRVAEKTTPKKTKREKSTERVLRDYAENNHPPPLIFPECLCNFGVCGSWAIRRMPHLQQVSERSHRADRGDVVVWKLEELVCVAKVRGHENTSNKVPSENQWIELVVVICRFCPNTSFKKIGTSGFQADGSRIPWLRSRLRTKKSSRSFQTSRWCR